MHANEGGEEEQLDGAAQVLLLTNDADNLRKAKAEGLRAQTVHAYVRSLPDAARLQRSEEHTSELQSP